MIVSNASCGRVAAQLKYIESSALVAALLEHDTSVTKRLPAGARRVTSALELLGEPPALVTIVTRDESVRANARALGYPVE